MKFKKKKIRNIAIGLLLAFLIAILGFYIYTQQYYKADEEAKSLFETSKNIVKESNYITIYPSKENDIDTLFIFYPGGKVEAISYLPILSKLSKEGVTCVLVEMPFRLAVFNIRAADRIIEQFKDIDNFFIGGHSLGGAMASSYVAKSEEEIKGLILLSAYPINDEKIPTIAVYGSKDGLLDKSKLDNLETKHIIEGANHAYFGNYGDQKKDLEASISRKNQQDQAVEIIIDFIKKQIL